MRTSGAGREGWMTIIPLAVIVLFSTIVAGGPKQLLVSIEKMLRSGVEWAVNMTR
jgi:hypothetical protein